MSIFLYLYLYKYKEIKILSHPKFSSVKSQRRDLDLPWEKLDKVEEIKALLND